MYHMVLILYKCIKSIIEKWILSIILKPNVKHQEDFDVYDMSRWDES
jgi:hypothetical protein